ncbi:diguanylate cyclase [Paludisphaera soli]|uniref:diguanylate cyclase n=1 Tax=Paludisphaera soli TaxID=2712865 RepID=UPI0013EB8D3B|nr:diguanylate cyclase [Paludisphaera soli]
MTVRDLDSGRGGAPIEAAAVLVVDPDPAERVRVGRLIAADSGCQVRDAGTPEEALAFLRAGGVAAVLAPLPGGDAAGGLDLVRSIRRERPEVPVVLMIPEDDPGVEFAAEAVRLGAVAWVARERLACELQPILGLALRPEPHASRRRRGPIGLVRQESRFVLPADDAEATAAALDLVQEQIEALRRWDGVDVLRMRIALVEALRHARRGDSGRPDGRRTSLTVVHEPGLSRFTIRDEGRGPGTDLAAEAPPGPSASGLLLMRSFMDEVRFHADGEGDGVELVKRADDDSPPPPESDPIDGGFARRLLDALPDAAYFVDPSGRILYWNPAAARLIGYTREEISRSAASADLLAYTDWSGASLAREDYPGFRAMRAGRPVELLVFVCRRDHRRVWVEARGAPVCDLAGGVAGAVVVLRDATSTIAVEEALRQARRAAESDPLTGLANRRSLDRMLDLHFQMLEREGRPFSLIMADLDHFKAINDGWGHDVGDRALLAFAAMLQNQSRSEDLVIRFGGEEFVILLPDHTLAVAARIAERLRAATPTAAPPEILHRPFTASFGVAQAAAGEPAPRLIRRVDAALYRAKAEGRDRVAVDGAAGGS